MMLNLVTATDRNLKSGFRQVHTRHLPIYAEISKYNHCNPAICSRLLWKTLQITLVIYARIAYVSRIV
jgi:hypothetical protein